MRVYIDDQIFGLQSRGGISRYFVELMRAFRQDPHLGVDVTTPPLWTINQHLLEAGWGRSLPHLLGSRRKVLRALNRVGAPRRAEVVHHTYYDRTYLGRGGPRALRVVTIYDMIPELLPETFPTGSPHRDKRAFVEAADLVLCISESTRRDLLTVYGSPQAPVMVTPLGVDDRFVLPAPRPAGVPDRYVLFVGNRSGYKDFAVLAEAFSSAEIPADVVLLAVGGGAWEVEELLLLERLGIAGRARQAALPDGDMPGVYAHAACFIFPSRYEGFGLPTLEAMAAGCPVVLANSSSHPEVGGDAALYVAPGDTTALAAAIEMLHDDPAVRSEHVLLGRQRAAGFTWASTAQATAACYRSQMGTRTASV